VLGFGARCCQLELAAYSFVTIGDRSRQMPGPPAWAIDQDGRKCGVGAVPKIGG
jgi:hypothetical protein